MGQNLKWNRVRPVTLCAAGCVGLMIISGVGCGNRGGENPEVLTKKFPGQDASGSGGSKAPAATTGAGQK